MNITEYWDRRYRSGRTSGAGSEGDAAEVKAVYVRDLLERERVSSIIDWGVGDGTVLKMIDTRIPYIGADVSRTIVARMKVAFRNQPEKQFLLANNVDGRQADLAMSLDVLFHQVDDIDYELHLHRLFGSAQRLVLIQSSNHDGGQTWEHVRWRRFTPDVMAWYPQWHLEDAPDDPERVGFYLYRRVDT